MAGFHRASIIAFLGNLPVFLSIGNHETTLPSTREKYLIQFADWLTTPVLRAQRLKDDPADHKLRTYYHWVRRNVDFITLDNASTDQFDAEQLRWLHSLLQRDEASGDIRSIVVGMHAALPGSFGYSHSMSDWPQGLSSGREVYEALLHARDVSHKRVYVLSSHSHFYMEDVYGTDYWKGKVLPGWDRRHSRSGPLQASRWRHRTWPGRCCGHLRVHDRDGQGRRIGLLQLHRDHS